MEDVLWPVVLGLVGRRGQRGGQGLWRRVAAAAGPDLAPAGGRSRGRRDGLGGTETEEAPHGAGGVGLSHG